MLCQLWQRASTDKEKGSRVIGCQNLLIGPTAVTTATTEDPSPSVVCMCVCVCFLQIYTYIQPIQLTCTLKNSLTFFPSFFPPSSVNQSRLWSVLRIVMETETVSQEYATVSPDFWGRIVLEVNTHTHKSACHPWRGGNRWEVVCPAVSVTCCDSGGRSALQQFLFSFCFPPRNTPTVHQGVFLSACSVSLCEATGPVTAYFLKGLTI